MLPRGVTQALSKKVGIEKRYLNIVHTESSCGWGGQEMRILSEAAGLLERGHQVSLLVPEEAPIYEQARRRNIPVTALPIVKKSPRALLSMVNWLRHHQPDIINTHSSTDSWLVALANTLLGADVPIVRTRHVSVAVARKLSNRWLYGRSVTKVVTTGESLRAELIKQLDLLPNHVVSIPSGVDLDHFNRATSCNVSSLRESIGLPAGGKVIGIVATIRSWKGHDDLLTAFEKAAMVRDDLWLLIIGDGPYAPVFKEHVDASPYRERILMVGQRQDIPELLTLLDIFVLPSYANEGVPQAVMQAMAMALPVISTHVGAINEVVNNNISGFLVTPRDTEALAARIIDLVDDPAKCREMGEQGRRIVEQQFSRVTMLDKMEAIFRECAVG